MKYLLIAIISIHFTGCAAMLKGMGDGMAQASRESRNDEPSKPIEGSKYMPSDGMGGHFTDYTMQHRCTPDNLGGYNCN